MTLRYGVFAVALLATSCAGTVPRTDGGPDPGPAFAVRAAQMNLAEIEWSRIARERAFDPKVQVFAERMIVDHSRSMLELQDLGGRKGWVIPDRGDPAHQIASGDLAQTSGQVFDRAYMQAMVSDHVAAVSLYRRYVRRGDDPELRDWARRTLRTLEAHSDLAHTTHEWVRR